MSLLYHAYVYLEFLILACTIYILAPYGPGKVGKLSDGTTVVARPGSTTGGASLEIRVSNRKVYKIRY
jgi:hypothetical protein